MTTGISKEELRKLRDHYFSLGINPVIDINNLIEQCKELNPWIPIDENTPKGVGVLVLFDDGDMEVARLVGDNSNAVWLSNDNRDLDYGFDAPTHYQELPEAPL